MCLIIVIFFFFVISTVSNAEFILTCLQMHRYILMLSFSLERRQAVASKIVLHCLCEISVCHVVCALKQLYFFWSKAISKSHRMCPCVDSHGDAQMHTGGQYAYLGCSGFQYNLKKSYNFFGSSMKKPNCS